MQRHIPIRESVLSGTAGAVVAIAASLLAVEWNVTAGIALALCGVFVGLAAPRLSRAQLRREDGQNLVEFAFILPLLALLVITITMIALAMHTRSNLQQAVREGARQAAVGKPLTEVQNLASGNSGGTLAPGEIDWCLPSGSSGSVGDQVRIFVDEGNDASEGYEFVLIPSTGIFAAFGWTGASVDMAPRATARLEKSVSGIPACSS